MKTETNNTIDLSSQIENIARGDGFYSVFLAEHQRNSRPARQTINGLKDLFNLLYNPVEEFYSEEKSLNKLSQLTNKVLIVYESSNPKDFLRKLRKRVLKICEKIKSENLNELNNPPVEQDNTKSVGNEQQDIDDAQKELIYNMLLANGVSPEEALNELIKY